MYKKIINLGMLAILFAIMSVMAGPNTDTKGATPKATKTEVKAKSTKTEMKAAPKSEVKSTTTTTTEKKAVKATKTKAKTTTTKKAKTNKATEPEQK
ncbi:MAG TPA: hypothetical protein P5545_01695 [Bacteroidota bacterium]|nr:hypothetical protein [Bacteroidota bacterium]